MGVYHQTSAVCMAVAHNYQAGQLVAATLVSAGPAVTNALTGLLVARDNGWPVIVLGGRRSSFQRFDAIPMARHVTKHALQVGSADCIRRCVHDAFQIAVAGRPGPVFLDLHEDALEGRGASVPACEANMAGVESVPPVAEAEVERIAAALLSARRPALLLGEGVRWNVVPSELQEVVEAMAIPFITSPMGRGFVSDDHPLCGNQARTVLQSQADVVLVLGARLNWMFRHGAELSSDAHVVRVDTDRGLGDEAAIAADFVQADAGHFVTRLLRVLRTQQGSLSNGRQRRRLDDWHRTLRAASVRTQRRLEQRVNDDGRPMSPYRMMKEIRDALPRDGICITEGNISMSVAQQVIPAFRPASRMDAGTSACMGVGIPFAIGAKVACPDRPVVAVVGDYGFSLVATEMEACVRHDIPIVVVVANNQGNNGAIKQKLYFPDEASELVTMFQPGLQYDQLTRTFGVDGATIADPGLIAPTLEKAIAAGRPWCINVAVDPNAAQPNAWGEQSANGEVTG